MRIGSSPLARGLPPDDDCQARPPGIIPARAGFTRRVSRFVFWFWDHPRSRGVYPIVVSYLLIVMGSSPLARGLPAVKAGLDVSDRIIPARAGFTLIPGFLPPGSWDHPRSRGVYGELDRAKEQIDGSSPLARGLRRPPDRRRRRQGIIPARAGFTESAPQGVRSVLGSSPLARGLPCGCAAVGGGSWDHPRSRGVYFLSS